MSESIYYGDGAVPGGGTDVTGNPCDARSEPGLLPRPFLCTLPAGHEGWHEAGTAIGLMVATWSDE